MFTIFHVFFGGRAEGVVVRSLKTYPVAERIVSRITVFYVLIVRLLGPLRYSRLMGGLWNIS